MDNLPNLMPFPDVDSYFLSIHQSKSTKTSGEEYEGPVAMATGRRHWSEKYMRVSMDEGMYCM